MRRRFELLLNFNRPAFGIGDGLIILIIAVLLYLGARLAINAPASVSGPTIDLSPRALPWYAFLSTGRMAIAYLLSLVFTLVYGYASARNRTAERIMMPLLDVLQSVPILSFLPVVLLSLTAILPQRFATELAAIILIVTSQAWNMTYSFYQSMKTIPTELREASSIFRLNGWLRFRTMELPFAALGLIWNSMMSWAGGWFFLMASEIFTVGSKDFRLPGLGSYLQTAANEGNVRAIFFGIGTLILVIVLLDQLVWRPVLTWANKFKVEMVESDTPPESWFYDLLSRSWIIKQLTRRVWHPLNEKIDRLMGRIMPAELPAGPISPSRRSIIGPAIAIIALVGLIYGGIEAIGLLAQLPVADYGRIGVGLIATLLRVALSLVIAVAWTIPVGVLIGSNQKLAAFLQPVVQVVASIPATALFPVIVLALINLTGGLDVSAVILMLLGTQWYVLFNVIAGASAIPQDLSFTTALLQVKGWARWRTLILPALFPYLITGMITASGGAWNASIVAEHINFSGQSLSTTGVGALIAEATATGNYPLLLASTLALIITVVTINRTFWRRLYKVAEERYRME
ncbi:MAG TPA: ABC transporter permease subunit [Anaerolineae bacterium]|nr:ABC transporter permease subunit [Anaerolineae bacterium]